MRKETLKTISETPVNSLGLAGQQPMDEASAHVAFEAGVNYFFCYNLAVESFLKGLKPLAASHREELFITTGHEQRDLSKLRHYRDRVRHALQVDVIDAFFAEYLSPADNTDQIHAVLEELHTWKENGLVRYVGATTHNRAIALQLIKNRQCDVLMHRYNMAHRKAETDVLPAAQQANLPVVAFTCTRWGSLLSPHPGWTDDPPRAADCYRYVLQHPAVHVALTAPKAIAHLQENLTVLHAPPFGSQEIAHWQQYGDIVYGNGQDAFETQWL